MNDDDLELVSKLRGNLDDYFHLLMEKYWGPIFRWIFSKIRNWHDAEEITIQIFEKVYRALPGYLATEERPMHLKQLLYTVARRCIIDFSKSQKPCESLDNQETQDVVENMPAGQNASPLSRAMEKESLLKICCLLDRLPPEQRDTLALHFLFEMSYSEAAEVLNLPKNTVKSHGTRGLKQLKKLLEAQSYEQALERFSNEGFGEQDYLRARIWLKRLEQLFNRFSH